MKTFLRVLFLLSGVSAFAQFTVTPNSTANVLAQKIAGSGLVVFNATLNCGATASGTFDYAGTSQGISKGIILCTGAATDVANGGTFFCNTMNSNLYSDPDLMAIEPNATNDACILEFDVVALYNNVNISFIFGSEEYPNFVGSFNDAFGFFLTGPNPAGGNYVGTNIGTLPNDTAVSINNVNAGRNATYFYDNYTSPNGDVAYDGYTVLINSKAPIYADSTYHMKIAIADALDEAYDSGIMIHDSLFTSKPNATDVPYFEKETLRFFPNPGHDVLKISMKITEGSQVELFNSAAQKVAGAKIDPATGTMDISALDKGIYFLRISAPKGKFYSGKFVKN